ncbi:MAG TPA: hypothetical protein VJT75_19435 [Thermoleophilaceae bacterium]|nr:hypothetical protein [Thermoleophilaceae bacterium]
MRSRHALLALLCALAAAATGCAGGNTTDLERSNARKVVNVVEGNMMAAERGDAVAYCAAFTDRYLEERFKGGVASCRRRFKGAPASLTESSEVRFLGATTVNGSDVDASVHYRLGDTRGLNYIMKFTEPPGGGARRWLIDGRVLPDVLLED